MEKLKIKHESVAVRCEICHQSDLLDPVTEKCARCNNVTTDLNKDLNKKDYVLFNKRNETNPFFYYNHIFWKRRILQAILTLIKKIKIPKDLAKKDWFFEGAKLKILYENRDSYFIL